MARSAKQISQSMETTVRTADSTSDVSKGPIFDLLMAPVAPELAFQEQNTEDLRTISTLQMDKVATKAEIQAIGTSFSLAALTGKATRYRQMFFTFTRPTTDLPIERGTLVGTTDASRVYQVLERVVMLSSNADAYYNAVRRRYEITATIEATAIGESHNLPAYRVKKILTKLNGFDGTENTSTPVVYGSDSQTVTDYFNRIKKKFAGLNPSAGGGITTRVLEYAPTTITDINLVYPKDRDVFRRDTGRPAIDVYIIGEELDTAYQREIAVGGETSFVLDKPPVQEISSVQIDGESVSSYSLVQDSKPSTSGSARSSDRIVFSTAFEAGQGVEITYIYDSLVYNMQADLFDANGAEFSTDILVRRPQETPVVVKMDVTVLASADVNRATDSIKTLVFDYVETNKFTTSLIPEVLRQTILGSVSGVTNVKIQRFSSSLNGKLPIETIPIKKNQVPVVDQDTLSIKTHQ